MSAEQQALEEFAGFSYWIESAYRPAPTREPDVREAPQPTPQEYPTSFDGVVGQADAIALLRAEVAAAMREGRALRHMMLYGPPGTGKTLLAHVLAHEARCLLYESSGAEYMTQAQILEAFASIGRLWDARVGNPAGVVWLVDEADALPRVASYALHPLLTHGYVTWQGQRYGGVPISVVLTTNRLSAVPPALRSRAGESIFVDFLSPAELAEVATRAAARMLVRLDTDAATFLGENAAGEGRKVLHLLRGARNLGEHVTLPVAQEALRLSGLRRGGLSRPQFEMLQFLAESEHQTASLHSISAFVGMEAKDLRDSAEPYLIRSRLVSVVRSGRRLTSKAAAYLQQQ